MKALQPRKHEGLAIERETGNFIPCGAWVDTKETQNVNTCHTDEVWVDKNNGENRVGSTMQCPLHTRNAS